MLFETLLNVADIEIEGTDEHVMVSITAAFNMPVGPNQVAVVPLGILRIPLGRDNAIEKGKALTEAGKGVKPPSDIVVAQDLSNVSNVVQQDKKLRTGKA